MKARMVIGLSTLCLMFLLAGGVFAEKLDCSGTKKSKEQVQTATLKPGDLPDRELVQLERIDVVSSANPEFNGIEQRVYVQLDHIAGTGQHSGYAMYPLKSGEKLWVKFQGSHYFTARGDSWELPVMGSFRFISGTGKYKAIHGGGHYKGVATPAGLAEEFVCTAQY